MQSVLDRINDVVSTTNTTDFLVQSFADGTLLLIGSFDLHYYHEVEVRFHDVVFVGLPIYGLDSPMFSVASDEERQSHAHLELDEDDVLFRVRVDADVNGGKIYYIASKQVTVSEGIVYHYLRDDLKEGERIAEWVKPTG